MKQRMNQNEKFVEEENDFDEEDDNDGGALIFENTQYEESFFFFNSFLVFHNIMYFRSIEYPRNNTNMCVRTAKAEKRMKERQNQEVNFLLLNIHFFLVYQKPASKSKL